MRDEAYAASVEIAQEKGAFPLLDARAVPRRAALRFAPAGDAEGEDPQARHAQQPPAVDRAHRHHLARLRRQRERTASSRRSPGPTSARSAARRHASRSTTSRTTPGACTGTSAATWSKLPPQFVTALEISALDHMRMVAAVAPFVDSAISKTVNVPEDYPYEDFKDLYLGSLEVGAQGHHHLSAQQGARQRAVRRPDAGSAAAQRPRHLRRRPPHPSRGGAAAGAVQPALAGPAEAPGRQSVVDLHGRVALRPVRDLRRPRRERRSRTRSKCG